MDPITVILSAVSTAGATVAGQAVSDGYEGLKRLIVRKFGSKNPRLEQHLDDFLSDEDTYRKPAEKALLQVGAADDDEVVHAAVEVLHEAERAHPGIIGGLVGQINAEGVVVAGTVYGGVHFGA